MSVSLIYLASLMTKVYLLKILVCEVIVHGSRTQTLTTLCSERNATSACINREREHQHKEKSQRQFKTKAHES